MLLTVTIISFVISFIYNTFYTTTSKDDDKTEYILGIIFITVLLDVAVATLIGVFGLIGCLFC